MGPTAFLGYFSGIFAGKTYFPGTGDLHLIECEMEKPPPAAFFRLTSHFMKCKTAARMSPASRSFGHGRLESVFLQKWKAFAQMKFFLSRHLFALLPFLISGFFVCPDAEACDLCSEETIKVSICYAVAPLHGGGPPISVTAEPDSEDFSANGTEWGIVTDWLEAKVPSDGFFLSAKSNTGGSGRNYTVLRLPCGVKHVSVSGIEAEIPNGEQSSIVKNIDLISSGSNPYIHREEFFKITRVIDAGSPVYYLTIYEEHWKAFDPPNPYTVDLNDGIHRRIDFYYGGETSQKKEGNPKPSCFQAHWTLSSSGVDVRWRADSLAECTQPSSVEFFYGSIDIEEIPEAGGRRQLRVVGNGAVDVFENSGSLTVAFYPENQVGGTKVNGFYPVSGTPTRKTVISPASGSALDYKKYENGDEVGHWQLSQPSGASSFAVLNVTSGKMVVKTKDHDGDEHTMTDEIWDANPNPDKLLQKVTKVTKDFAWGSETVTEIMDPDGEARTTSYTYHGDNDGVTDSEARYGKVKSIAYSDGSWVRYDYDQQGRVMCEYQPWKDYPATSDEADDDNGRFVYTTYSGNRVATRETFINSMRTNREEYAYTSGTEAGTGAALDIETQTLKPSGGPQTVTVTRRYQDGRTQCIDYPDGRRDTYKYENGSYNASTHAFTVSGNGTATHTWLKHGTTQHPEGIDYKSTWEATTTDENGNTVVEETYVWTDSEENQLFETIIHAYDEDGHLTESKKNGRVIYSAVYDDGELVSETDETGIVTEYPDSLTVIKKGVAQATISGVTYPAQPDITTSTVKDLLGRVVSETTTSGNLSLPTRTTTYTVVGDIDTVTEGGLTTDFNYEDGGRKTTTIYPTGGTEIVENYVDGQIKSRTGTAIVSQFFDYGVHDGQSGYADGTLWTKIVPGVSNSQRWEKTTTNGEGSRMLKREQPGTPTVTMSYNSSGQLTSEARDGLGTIFHEYDELGRECRAGIDMNGSNSLTLASTDRVTHVEQSYLHDEDDGSWMAHTVVKSYLTDNSSTPTTTSERREIISEMDPDVLAFVMDTDALGRWFYRTARVDRNQKFVTETFSGTGSGLTATTIARNGLPQSQSTREVQKPTKFSYDALGREITRTEPHNDVVTQTAYDPTSGRLASQMTGPDSTEWEYYPASSGANTGQLKKLTENGLSKYYAWTMRGELYRQWGAQYPAEFSYNDYGQLATMKTYQGPTSHAVPVLSTWTSSTWPGSPGTADTTTWNYHEATGLLSGKKDAANKGPSYTWNDAGLPATRTLARNVTTTYGYNAAGETTSQTYTDATPATSTAYNRRGLPAVIVDGSGTHALTYTLDGQLQGEVYTAGALTGWGTHRTFYSSGARIGKQATLQLLSPDPVTANSTVSTQQFDYDSHGRLNRTWVSTINNVYSYSSNSTLISSSTQGWARFTNTWDSYNRLSQISGDGNDSGSLSTVTYQFNSANQRSRVTFEDARYWDFTYNVRGELETGTHYLTSSVPWSPSSYYIWHTDNIGSLFESLVDSALTTYDTNALNQYTTITTPGTTQNYTYDFDGNLVSRPGITHTWDGENRLSSVTQSSNTTAYIYDAEGRRTAKVSSNGTVLYVYDGWNMIAEVFVGTSPLKVGRYFWGLDLIGQRTGRLGQEAGGMGGLWFGNTGNYAFFPKYDGNGNMVKLLDGSGNHAGPFRYDPWGNLVSTPGTLASDVKFRYGTNYQDPETGYYLIDHRYYDPVLRRWLSRDPLGSITEGLENAEILNETSNPYRFVANDPVNNFDPFGLWTVSFNGDGWSPGRIGYFNGRMADVARGIDRMIIRTDQLIAKAEKMTDGCCLKKQLIKDLKGWKKNLLQNMQRRMKNRGLILPVKIADLSTADNGGPADGIANFDNWAYKLGLVSNELDVFTGMGVDLGFFNNSIHANETLFHELSHISGTKDTHNDKNPISILWNAQVIDPWISFPDSFTAQTYWNRLKAKFGISTCTKNDIRWPNN